MAPCSKFSSQEISLAMSEVATALSNELRDNLKHFKQTNHCSLESDGRTIVLELLCLNSVRTAAMAYQNISSADDFLLRALRHHARKAILTPGSIKRLTSGGREKSVARIVYAIKKIVYSWTL